MKTRLALLLLLGRIVGAQIDESLLGSLSNKKAVSILESERSNGRVGGAWDFRVTNTDRSFNYKLRATPISARVATALAHLLVNAKGIQPSEARATVSSLLEGGYYYLMIELDPREGSGVIPSDWTARLGNEKNSESGHICEKLPDTGPWAQIIRAFPRDYAYDAFLVRVARVDGGKPIITSGLPVELRVHIENKSGTVRWNTPF